MIPYAAVTTRMEETRCSLAQQGKVAMSNVRYSEEFVRLRRKRVMLKDLEGLGGMERAEVEVDVVVDGVAAAGGQIAHLYLHHVMIVVMTMKDAP